MKIREKLISIAVTVGFIFNIISCISVNAVSEQTDLWLYDESESITFDNQSGNVDCTSDNGMIMFKTKTNKNGDYGSEIICEPDNESNNVAAVKNLYDSETNSDGTVKQNSLVSAYLLLGDLGNDVSHRISWRMKTLGGSKTEIYLESETSTSKSDFEFLAYTGIGNDGLLLGPNAFSGSNKITNELTKSVFDLGDDKWHNFEAYLYSGGKKSDNNRKVVELYCDGVLYARYERVFPHSLKQIEIYSRGTENADALYLDDISISRIPNDFYITTEYDESNLTIDLLLSLYPDTNINALADKVQADNADISSREVTGRKIRLRLNQRLTGGKVYTLGVPDDLTSEGAKILSSSAVINVPPDQPGEIKITTDKTGSIFTDSDDFEFKINLINSDVKTQSFVGRAWVTAEDGTIVWNNIKENNISVLNVIPNGTRSIEIKPIWEDKTHRYGRFCLNIEIKPTDSETYKNASKQFTRIYSNGFINDRTGIGSHYARTKKNSLGNWTDDVYSVGTMGNIEDVMKAQSLAGCGVSRDDMLSYANYYSKDTVPTEFIDKTYANYNDMGANLVQILSMSFYAKTGLYRSGESAYEGLHMMPIAYVDEYGNIDDSELVNFKNKVKELAKFNTKSHTYELFNEWNLSTWKKKFDLYERKDNKDVLVKEGYQYTIEQYIQAVKAASEAIREVDPQAKILGCGSAKDYMPEFIDECLKNGIAQYIDAVSIHPYSVSVAPEIGHKDKDKAEAVPLREKVMSVQALLDKYDADIPIVITEIGWTNASQTPITEEVQAQYSIRALGLAGDLTDFVSFYEAVEHYNSDPYEQHYGMLYRNDGSDNALGAKPVFSALSCFNSLTSDKEHKDGITVDENNGSVYCTYENECEKVIMYWNPNADDQSLSIPKSNDDGDSFIRDMYGNIIDDSINANGDKYEVLAGQSPRYLVINKNIESGLYVTLKYLKADNAILTKAAENRLIETGTTAKVQLKTAFKNTGSHDESISAIVAAYDEDGRLTNVDVKTYTVKPDEVFMPNDMPTIERKDNESVKGYIWNIKLLKPVSYDFGTDKNKLKK